MNWKEIISNMDTNTIAQDRKDVLQPVIDYVQNKVDDGKVPVLNYICTHNSRRSQLSQVWGYAAAAFYGIEIVSYSGGVEVTAFNERAVREVVDCGFEVSIKDPNGDNPIYEVRFDDHVAPLMMFSKVFDDKANSVRPFAAIMTCGHADENCPFIPDAEARLAVRYEDPKAFDDTDKEAEMYHVRSMQIAQEMKYVFSSIQKK
ncbi:protein-tyrosine-phosphatase [Halosquirtibacter xylanolyticus]|uniref:protein-tyrosine-phosphatase n=1 Tax=Halosquirtibacter xylanolyticus TaxID=3374599 RepID=UPI0037488975|nr:protein-tyrosine-phosphatase [Prolixibacteraceae bacterium]